MINNGMFPFYKQKDFKYVNALSDIMTHDNISSTFFFSLSYVKFRKLRIK